MYNNALYNRYNNIDIHEIVLPVYETFSKYKVSEDMDYCPCCISSEEVNNLCSVDLRHLEREDFARYSGKALSTWGNAEDFKHFLPRLLELEVFNQYGLHYLTSKFELADFSTWPPIEKQTIHCFFNNYFIYLVNKNKFNRAIELLHEFRKIIPEFLTEQPTIENYVKMVCYNSIEYTQNLYDSDSSDILQLLFDAFEESSIIKWIQSWPEDEIGILKFSTLIDSPLIYSSNFIDNNKIKFLRMKDLLENYWISNCAQGNAIVLENVSKAVQFLEFFTFNPIP